MRENCNLYWDLYSIIVDRFVNNFARLAALLFTLCKKDTEFKWTEKHHEGLSTIEKEIYDGRLAPFSLYGSTKLVVDASEYALGGVLEQDVMPVICISRKLSNSE